MGTRNLTAVVLDGEYRVAQYGQWDGYPSGQGATVLKFLKEMGREKFEKKLRSSRFLTKEDLETHPANGDPDWSKNFPELSRDVCAGILKMIQDSVNGLQLKNSIDFANDSLFCEWAYVIDLDNDVLEVYEGFNKSPLDKSERFYTGKSNDRYHPIRLLEKFDINNLPSEEEFIKILDPSDCE